MSNVIPFAPAHRRLPQDDRLAAMMSQFGQARRDFDSVFWLKENAELLNVLESTGQAVATSALDSYRAVYDGLEDRLQFFPQYYRFLLSIALDLEALGLDHGRAHRMARWVVDQDLVRSELSDLQRAEARRLVARAGVQFDADPDLDTRLHRFIDHAPTFALPNKKAAYELTHILFYLSEYGRRDPNVSPKAIESLHYVGILAMLERNADLLAEVCVALTFAGTEPPAAWSNWIIAHLDTAQWVDSFDAVDDYHEYFMCDWFAQICGHTPFASYRDGGLGVHMARSATPPLRVLSETLFGADRRLADEQMRRQITLDLPDDVYDAVAFAEQSSPYFDRFFATFARSEVSVQFR